MLFLQHGLRVELNETGIILLVISNCIAYLNTCINPIIYGFANQDFRTYKYIYYILQLVNTLYLKVLIVYLFLKNKELMQQFYDVIFSEESIPAFQFNKIKKLNQNKAQSRLQLLVDCSFKKIYYIFKFLTINSSTYIYIYIFLQ